MNTYILTDSICNRFSNLNNPNNVVNILVQTILPQDTPYFCKYKYSRLMFTNITLLQHDKNKQYNSNSSLCTLSSNWSDAEENETDYIAVHKQEINILHDKVPTRIWNAYRHTASTKLGLPCHLALLPQVPKVESISHS